MALNQAEQIARETMAAVLPPGSPMIFNSIERATFRGKNTIIVELTMFDGLPGIARLERWPLGWSIGWDEMPNRQAASLEDGVWRRVPE